MAVDRTRLKRFPPAQRLWHLGLLVVFMILSVTGIAGPDGGTDEKPVGTVYIGLFYNNQVKETLHHFNGNRKDIQEMATQTALDTVRRALLAL